MRVKLENERQALTAFVSKFDTGVGLGLPSLSTFTPFNPPKPTPGGVDVIFAKTQKNHLAVSPLESPKVAKASEPDVDVTELLLHVFTKVKVDS